MSREGVRSTRTCSFWRQVRTAKVAIGLTQESPNSVRGGALAIYGPEKAGMNLAAAEGSGATEETNTRLPSSTATEIYVGPESKAAPSVSHLPQPPCAECTEDEESRGHGPNGTDLVERAARREAILRRPVFTGPDAPGTPQSERDEEAGLWVPDPREMGAVGRLLQLADRMDLIYNPRRSTMGTGPMFVEEIPIRHIEWDDRLELGAGAFGVVESGTLRRTQRVAMKSVFLSRLRDPPEEPEIEEIDNFQREVETYSYMDHINVLKIIGVVRHQGM
ncbi:unnamed protein product [Vitrella brassicaformis CCMP3155]|uniref:Protein kinase domain-containing protein n=1 Tax=Vitrella brassicaformis (strain CCMP3155) TaxID=1169540 RepID=A0A0G4EQJ2_VITBC|nr:unnamed protein product [Vitrella brassicaformis CCMP3155]|eukprot:CEL99906.1 unnamed protein product [Vitrella brassicaformis CCMP3155]